MMFPFVLSVTVKLWAVSVAGSIGFVNCTWKGALTGTPELLLVGLV